MVRLANASRAVPRESRAAASAATGSGPYASSVAGAIATAVNIGGWVKCVAGDVRVLGRSSAAAASVSAGMAHGAAHRHSTDVPRPSDSALASDGDPGASTDAALGAGTRLALRRAAAVATTAARSACLAAVSNACRLDPRAPASPGFAASTAHSSGGGALKPAERERRRGGSRGQVSGIGKRVSAQTTKVRARKSRSVLAGRGGLAGTHAYSWWRNQLAGGVREDAFSFRVCLTRPPEVHKQRLQP